MTALKINRFSLNEINEVTIRCKKCGAGHIAKLDGVYFSAAACPSCLIPFGEVLEQAFEHIKNASQISRIENTHFDIEFDIVEK